MDKKKIRDSLLVQVAALFLVGVLAIGALTYFNQHAVTSATVKERTEELAENIAEEVVVSIREYPAYKWLISYWYDHYWELDIEYDVDYNTGKETEEKCRLFSERYPDLQLNYITEEDLKKMPEEDQSMYAEIAYSWLTTRVNQIKQTYEIDYLFGILTDDSFSTQFFVFSGADPGAKRGTQYEEVYLLGKQVTVSDEQKHAMMDAKENDKHLVNAGNYVDYYDYMETVDGRIAMIGMTYNTTVLNDLILTNTWVSTRRAMVYQVILSLIFLLMIYYFVINPMKKVQANIREYKEEKNSDNIIWKLAEIHPHNEIGELSEDISTLAMEMDNYINNLQYITAEKERMGTELDLAKRIQASMMPHVFPPFPDRNEFDIYATMDPAKEVGGDFFDFFLIDDDHLCLLIADVSGKGIPAALFMMVSKIILQSCAMLGKSVSEILTKTNEGICSNNVEQMFVTVWLGILEISTGKIIAANAGHEYPIVKKADGNFEVLKDKHGFVIGGMEDVIYKEYEIQLEPGAKLFLYTDGAPEATDENSQMFGTDRLVEILNQNADESPKQILGNVQKSIDEFVKDAEQFDDLTMLCLEYKGPIKK